MEEWKEELVSRYGLSFAQLGQFSILLNRLASEGGRGLTAVTGTKSIVNVHFLDSLWLMNLPQMRAATNLIDIGSGAGFPGLPLAIANPQVEVSMLEANNKKAAFISATVEELGLANASVICQRAEDAGRTALRDHYDVAVARAVGSMPEVLEYALPLVKVGGHALLQRGAREAGDEAVAKKAAAMLGGSLEWTVSADPYPGARNLHIWVWEKGAATPDRYPRRAGMPRKRPLA